MPAGFEGSIKAREAELLPVYRQARLHDSSSSNLQMTVAPALWSAPNPFDASTCCGICADLYASVSVCARSLSASHAAR